MDSNSADKQNVVPVARNLRAFNKQFKNPPQPHMCIQDFLKNTTDELYINVLAWQKIASPKHFTDPIPLYGGMQVPQACSANSNKPPLLVFAVMVNPEILKVNGKFAANNVDREALVNLLCDFVEAMNPGLSLARNAQIMKDRDIAGELKDVWFAIQNKREKEKGLGQDYMYKVYDIDGIRENGDSTEQSTNNHHDIDQQNSKYPIDEDYDAFTRDSEHQSGWDEFSKRELNIIRTTKVDRSVLKHYESKKSSNNFFPDFAGKPLSIEGSQSDEQTMISWMEGIHLTDNNSSSNCDNKHVSSVSS